VFGHSDSSGNRNAAWSALTSLEIQGIYDCTIPICDMSEALVCCGFCSAWAGQSSVRLRLARLAVAHTWLNTRDDVRLRPFGATARQPSHLIMSEGWWTRTAGVGTGSALGSAPLTVCGWPRESCKRRSQIC
jgi:hypothetical protein